MCNTENYELVTAEPYICIFPVYLDHVMREEAKKDRKMGGCAKVSLYLNGVF